MYKHILRRGEKKICNIIIVIIIIVMATEVEVVSRALGRVIFSMIMTTKNIYMYNIQPEIECKYNDKKKKNAFVTRDDVCTISDIIIIFYIVIRSFRM